MYALLKKSVLLGGRQGLKSAWWLLKIMVPVSFAVALLNWTGAMQVISNAISPAFKYFGLPGSASLAFVSGALLNCYSAIAVMITLPLSHREITILALMVLFFHNIPIEAMVQKKTGSSALFMVLYRLFASLAGGFCLNLLMPEQALSVALASAQGAAPLSVSFSAMLHDWTVSSLVLIVKIMTIIVGLMILNRFLEESRAIVYLSKALSPVLRMLGLPSEAGFLFVVANTLGLAYGGGVMMAQKEEGKISLGHLRILNVFIATCHSLLEDTLLFVAIGAFGLWLVVPRLVLAGTSVWIYRGVSRVTGWDTQKQPAQGHHS